MVKERQEGRRESKGTRIGGREEEEEEEREGPNPMQSRRPLPGTPEEEGSCL
jgi:hypothetical protein